MEPVFSAPLPKDSLVATQSSHLGNYAHTRGLNAIDGDGGTFFQSNNGPFQWIQVDLGQEVTVS